MPAPETRPRSPDEDSLVHLLGGRRAALDTTVPPAAYVAAWLVTEQSIPVAAVAALIAAAGVAGWRWRHGHGLRAVLLGLLGVSVAAAITLYTGRGSDFFLLQAAGNVASALVWAISIVFRWPLLGVVVGGVLGQRTRWRQDRALLRGYQRASWVWVVQYLIRVVVFVPLWLADEVVLLGVARIGLSWPLVLACLVSSWWVLRRSLPAGHPGIRAPTRR